jgi:hypothetical protein
LMPVVRVFSASLAIQIVSESLIQKLWSSIYDENSVWSSVEISYRILHPDNCKPLPVRANARQSVPIGH